MAVPTLAMCKMRLNQSADIDVIRKWECWNVRGKEGRKGSRTRKQSGKQWRSDGKDEASCGDDEAVLCVSGEGIVATYMGIWKPVEDVTINGLSTCLLECLEWYCLSCKRLQHTISKIRVISRIGGTRPFTCNWIVVVRRTIGFKGLEHCALMHFGRQMHAYFVTIICNPTSMLELI